MAQNDQHDAGRTVNATYSLEGRNSGQLASYDAAELMKVTGMNLEQLAQRGDLRGLEGQVRPEILERLGRMGNIAVAGYDGSDRHLPWNLPELGPNGLNVMSVHDGDTNDLEAMFRSAKLLDWPMKVQPAEFRYGQTRVRATRPDPRQPEKALPYCFIVRGPVHDWPTQALGACSARYPLYTNEQLLEAMMRLGEGGPVRGDTVGHYDTGQKVFASMRIAETRYVLGDDPHDLMISFTLDHSGEGAILEDITVVRRFCLNTIKLARRHASSSKAIAHVGSRESVSDRVDQGARELLVAEGFFSDYEQTQAQLAEYEVDVDLFDKQIAAEIVKADTDSSKAEAMAATKREALVRNFESGPTLANLPMDGRRAVQAVNEHALWLTDVRSERARLTSAIEDNGRAVKRTRQAQTLVLERGRKRITR